MKKSGWAKERSEEEEEEEEESRKVILMTVHLIAPIVSPIVKRPREGSYEERGETRMEE